MVGREIFRKPEILSCHKNLIQKRHCQNLFIPCFTSDIIKICSLYTGAALLSKGKHYSYSKQAYPLLSTLQLLDYLIVKCFKPEIID